MTYKELVDKRKKYKNRIEGLINPNEDIETKIYDDGCYLEPTVGASLVAEPCVVAMLVP